MPVVTVETEVKSASGAIAWLEPLDHRDMVDVLLPLLPI
jgi:hypothetical protein